MNEIPEIDITIETKEVKAVRRLLVDTENPVIPVSKISWTEKNTFPVPTSPSDLLISYNPNHPGVLSVFNGNGLQNITADDVIKVAFDMQAKRRKNSEDVEDVHHEKLLDDIIKHIDEDDGSIQVLEGDTDKVSLDHFSGLTASSLIELIHFIKVNDLQDKKPWCIVWNLYRCMMVAAGR